jgi:predicted nucleotidyltransferase
MSDGATRIELLAKHLGVEWPHLARARQATAARLKELAEVLAGYDSLDLSVVVFGSLARRELTIDSDPDWTLLVDGAADPLHLDTSREIRVATR